MSILLVWTNGSLRVSTFAYAEACVMDSQLAQRAGSRACCNFSPISGHKCHELLGAVPGLAAPGTEASWLAPFQASFAPLQAAVPVVASVNVSDIGVLGVQSSKIDEKLLCGHASVFCSVPALLTACVKLSELDCSVCRAARLMRIWSTWRWQRRASLRWSTGSGSPWCRSATRYVRCTAPAPSYG
jgi:hypothetical protein